MKKLFLFLKEHNLTISSCESFTAGLFANEFCRESGSSQFFKGSIVCYDNEVKNDLLNITNETIKKYDVVSKEVSELMAINCAKLLKTDLCFSFTGYAPYTSNEKSGLSFSSIYFKGNIYTTKFYNSKISDRYEYQKKTIENALLFFKNNVIN